MDQADKILRILEGPQEYKGGILTEDSTLMTRMPDGPDDHLARGVYANQVKRVLTEFSPKRQSFTAKGKVTILMSWMDDGDPVEEWVEIPIRSIPEHTLDSISRKVKEIGANMPLRLNAETGEQESDRSSPDFMPLAWKLSDAQRELTYLKLLEGLDITIRDENDQVVWRHGLGGTKDKANAIRVLTDVMGITQAQIEKIVDAIDELSAGATAMETDQFEKK